MLGSINFGSLRGRIFPSALALACAGAFANTPTKGDLYFTCSSGSNKVNKIAFDFDGTTLVMGTLINIAQTQGADGLIFTPDNELLIGGQDDIIFKVNPVTGATVSHNAGGSAAFHLALDPSKTAAWASDWTANKPGSLARIPLNPFADGVIVPVQGDNLHITSLAFQDADHAFYTSSTDDAGVGDFGTIDMKTFTTHRLLSKLPGAHGMAYDTFSGTILLFGGIQVVQIDPATGAQVDSRYFNGSKFDQGTTDGKGHMFIADGETGEVLFMDYSATKKIGDKSNFTAHPFVANKIDDVAPLSGLGSNPIIPDPIIPIPANLLAVQKALYKDADGNGRIDQAWIEFPKANDKPPTQIQLQDPFNPGTVIVVSGSKITQIDATHILVDFKDKEFALGTGFEVKSYGKLLEDKTVFSGASFDIGDGVGPRPISVVSNPPQQGSTDLPKLTVTLSETVTVDVNSKTFPFEIKRNGTDPNGKIVVVSVKPLGGNAYEYTFDSTFFPIPGDSLRLKKGTPAIVDANGNQSNMTDYVPVGGKLLEVYYNLGPQPASMVTTPEIANPFPLPNSILLVNPNKANGCLNCVNGQVQEVIDNAVSAKPIKESKPFLISVKVNAPFHFDIAFYDNLGTFVNQAKGDLDQTALNRVQKDKDGNYEVGLFWWPVSNNGQLVGTGVYIARGKITTSGTIQTIQGSQGQYESVTNQSKNLFFTFGYLRRQ